MHYCCCVQLNRPATQNFLANTFQQLCHAWCCGGADFAEVVKAMRALAPRVSEIAVSMESNESLVNNYIQARDGQYHIARFLRSPSLCLLLHQTYACALDCLLLATAMLLVHV